MNLSFYSGVSGLSSYQEGMNMIANNVANANTNGYKPIKPSFKDLVYTKMDINSEKEVKQGHGVRLASADLEYKQGNMMQTGMPLDFAISGDGFFALNDNGDIKYTRNGAMSIGVENDTSYLCSYDGRYILDNEGEKIEIPLKETKDKSGNSSASEVDYSALQEKIGIYTFKNPYGLQPTDSGRFIQTDLSGKAVALTDENKNAVDLLSGTLESSAVDIADEFASMMMTQKAYQFSAKIVQTADQIEEIVNNLR